MNWGNSIVLAFILFAAFIFTLVGICVNQEVSLVSENYYQQEIEFDQQIQRLANTNDLKDKPDINYSSSDTTLSIKFPDSILAKDVRGTIQMFRPSDAHLDVAYNLTLDPSGFQKVDLSSLRKGLWTCKFNWIYQGKEYFAEKNIVL
jgi:hypothetical protein